MVLLSKLRMVLWFSGRTRAQSQALTHRCDMIMRKVSVFVWMLMLSWCGMNETDQVQGFKNGEVVNWWRGEMVKCWDGLSRNKRGSLFWKFFFCYFFLCCSCGNNNICCLFPCIIVAAFGPTWWSEQILCVHFTALTSLNSFLYFFFFFFGLFFNFVTCRISRFPYIWNMNFSCSFYWSPLIRKHMQKQTDLNTSTTLTHQYYTDTPVPTLTQEHHTDMPVPTLMCHCGKARFNSWTTVSFMTTWETRDDTKDDVFLGSSFLS